MRKIYFVATVSTFFNFFKGQLKFLSDTFDITIISQNRNFILQDIAVRESVKFKSIDIKRNISLRNDIKTLIILINFFKKNKPDIVHGNTPKGAFLSILAARIVGIKERVYMCHGLRYQGASGLLKVLLKFTENLTCRLSTRVICVSSGVQDIIIKEKFCSEEKVILLGNGSCNGIDGDYLNPDKVSIKKTQILRSNFKIKKENFIFSFIGRVVRDKGVLELVEAFNRVCSKYSNVTLLIIGSLEDYDSCYTDLKKMVLHQDKVIFTNRQEDIRSFLSLTDVLVLPSYREGFGMVLAEAAAMRVPVVTTDIEGCNNVVLENVNGVYCEPKDVKSLEEAMVLLMEDDDLYSQIRSKTRESILDRFNQEKVWDDYKKYYLSLI